MTPRFPNELLGVDHATLQHESCCAAPHCGARLARRLSGRQQAGIPLEGRYVMLAGVFVGGAGARMGGVAKGLLLAPDGAPIVMRTCRMLMALQLPCVLVGTHRAYDGVSAALGVRALADQPAGVGPLGGLIALLQHARGGVAIAIGGDMPYITPQLIAQLRAAPAAGAVAPRVDGRWQPMFARFDASIALPVAMRRAAASQLALHGLLEELRAQELPLSAQRLAELRDWDLPADVPS